MSAFPRIDVAQQRDWIAGLRAGTLDAFRAVFEAYTPQLCRFAQVSVPADVAEDLVQDVLFDLWQRRETVVVGDGELTQYLFGAVRNRVMQYLRHQRVVRRTEERDDDDVPGMGTTIASVESTVLAHDLESALAVSLEQLSEIQRAVLALRWTHGLSYEQIAGTLQISAQAARQHASRAQRVIRPLLVRYLDT